MDIGIDEDELDEWGDTKDEEEKGTDKEDNKNKEGYDLPY